MKKILVCFCVFILLPLNNIFGLENEAIKLSSQTAILMEQDTKRVLYGKDYRKKVKIASTTKILTAIVAIENCSLNEMVTISKKSALTGGCTVGLTYESKVSLNSLMYGMLLNSGNDCAVAIAEHVGGSVENFVKMMNKKAYEIGAKDTNCTNPHGLDTDNNYSTAYDLALITCYAKTNETLSKILGTQTITLPFGNQSKFLANTNKLLFSYKYCDGGKTGFTNIANRCLVATAKKDDLKVVAVVLGATTTNIRFNEAKQLLEYGIENYKMTDVSDSINWYIDIFVHKGQISSYVKKITFNKKIPLKQGELEQIYISQSIVPSLNAPCKRGSYLGKIQLYILEELLYTEDIYLDRKITKNTVLDYIIKGLKGIFELEIEF